MTSLLEKPLVIKITVGSDDWKIVKELHSKYHGKISMPRIARMMIRAGYLVATRQIRGMGEV